MPDANRKPEPGEIDPAKIQQLLEIEMMQQRASWQQAKARRGSLRAMSFFFLFLVIVGALFAYFVFLSPERLSELKSSAPPVEPSPAPSASR